MNNKLKRYHVEILVPAWGRESSLDFIRGIAGKPMGYSKHATKKSAKLSKRIKEAIKNILNRFFVGDEMLLDYVFEFYSDSDNKIRKMCFRFPMVEFGIDIIIVMSCRGTIVTIYINKDFDKHRNLNEKLYEKE